jgi:hypothetical protein
LYIDAGFFIGGNMAGDNPTRKNYIQDPISSDWGPQGKDSKTSSTRVLGIDHALIHDGKGYVSSIVASLASTASYDVIFTNPVSHTAHLIKYEWDTTGAPCTLGIYEGPFTVENSGTVYSWNNCDRDSSNVTSVGITVAASVTTTSSSTLIETHLIQGAKQTGGTIEGAAIEWVLKQSVETQYLYRLTNNSGGAISIGFFIFNIEPVGS